MDFNYTAEALYHPERFAPFQIDEEMPAFDGTTLDLTPDQAWHLSNLAHCAYLDGDAMSGVLETVGVELLIVVDIEGTQGFVARGTNYAVVSFRGTEPDDFADLKSDLDVLPVDFPAGGSVHRGFQTALRKVWADVEEVLDGLGDLPVWFTGHSLGAALATVAAAHRANLASTRLVTFGSPRVGDQDFVRLLENVPVFRYVDGADIVTMVPPRMVYRHVGTMVFVSEKKPPTVNPSSWYVRKSRFKSILGYWLRFPIFRKGEVKLRSLVDHAVVNYSAALGKGL